MTEAERALRAVIEAAVASSGVHTADIAVGPVPMTVLAEDPVMMSEVLAHAGEADPDWRPVRIVLATAASVPVDVLAAPLRPAVDPSEGTTIVRAGSLTAIVGDGMTWVVDDRTGTAVRWSVTAGDIPVWESGRPLRVALRWWSARHEAALLHTAALAHEDAAVLLVGAGGAGKSTTAYACLGRGVRVLGDDYCIVQRRPDGMRVHATYRLGNLTDTSLALLPWLRDRVVGTGHQGKAIVPLDPIAKGAGHARVTAVAAVRQEPGGATRLVPAPAFSVLQRFGPNSVTQVRGWNAETLETCVEVVRTAPTYELRVGSVEGVPDVLRDLLAVSA